MNERFTNPPGGVDRDANDWAGLRHARDRIDGFAVGRYLQPPPLLFTRDGLNVFLGDMYRGQSAFLICGGPSLKMHDLTLLDQRGILTLAVNNAATVYRPRLWVSVDDPGNFSEAIWYDPGITKFVPLCHMEKRFTVRDEQTKLVPSSCLVGDMPAVFGYRRNENFRAEQFLFEDTFNWGQHSNSKDAYGNKGSRSVMLVALRMLFYLGVRTIYLLGCDFRMEQGKQNYAFEQDRSRSSVSGNNSSYRILNVRLEHLKPHFEREGCTIFNCTPNSGLTVFPHLEYEQAVRHAREQIPEVINTAGMYDRKARQQQAPPLANGRSLLSSQAPSAASIVAPRSERPHVMRGAISPAPTPENLNQLTDSLSLIVPLDEASALAWPVTWKSWLKYKPWLCQLRLWIIHPETPQVRANELPSVQQGGRTRLISYSEASEEGSHGLLRTVIQVAARQVSTPWHIYLDPRAITGNDDPGLRNEWFLPNPDGPGPVLIASPWGYIKPADATMHLDQWADNVVGLQEHPPLNLSCTGANGRLKHATIAGWCLFGNTSWFRQIAEFDLADLPACWLQTALWYFATRRGEEVRRVRLKDYGWEYQFSSAKKTIERCKQLVT